MDLIPRVHSTNLRLILSANPNWSASTKSLAILILAVGGSLLGTVAADLTGVGMPIEIAVLLLPLMIGFFLIARLRCQQCGFRLSDKFPTGSLLLLFFSNQKCPSCGHRP